MKDLSDNSIDCFICDLPYGQLAQEKGATPFGRNTKGPANSGCPWDVKLDMNAFWAQVKRLARNDRTPVLMFCNTKFGYELIKSNESWFRYDLVWDKQRGVSFLLANKMPMKSHEMIYVFSKSGAFYNRIDVKGDFKETMRSGGGKGSKVYNMSADDIKGVVHEKPSNERCPLSVITLNNSAKKGQHPTEKPEELYEWLLRRYVPEGGTVLDPTAGSFNSCFVADRLGLVAIGIEKEEAFYEKAVARLNPTPPPPSQSPLTDRL